MLVQQRPYRVGDLLPPAVADRGVDLYPAGPVDGALLGGLERRRGTGRQQVQRADDAQPPRVAVLGQLGDQVLDDGEERIELGGRPAQIVGGQQVQRDQLDPAGLVAPAQQVQYPPGADPVPVVRVDVPHLLGPPAVAVAHHADVQRPRLATQYRGQPPLVHRVGELTEAHVYAA